MQYIITFLAYFAAIYVLDYCVHSWGFIYYKEKRRPKYQLEEIRHSARYRPLKPLRLSIAFISAIILSLPTRDADYGLYFAIPLVAILISYTCYEFYSNWREAENRFDH